MTSLVQISRLGKCDTRAPTNVSSQRGFANIQEDILSQVFLLLSRDIISCFSKFGKEEWDWASVSEVCRYWYAVATRNSKLWTLLDQFYWTKRFQMSMRLSRKADLTIYYNSNEEDAEFGNLKIALKEMGRIRHLELAAEFSDVQVAELLPYLELPASRMQTLSIRTSAFNALSRSRFPFRSPGVSLKILLRNTKLPSWLSGQTRLSELSLRSCNFSLLELLGILNTSPTLKVLSLVTSKINSDTSAVTQSVYLPHLETLHMEHTQINNAFGILQMIEAPNVSFWGLHFSGKLELEHTEKLKMFSRLIRRDFQADEMSIDAYYATRFEDFSFIQHQKTLEFQFRQVDRNTILQHLINISRRHLTRISVLRVSARGDNISTETWRSVYEVCTSAKVFQTSLYYEDLGGGALSELPAHMPYIEELGRSFPDLEHLVVTLKPSVDCTGDTEWFVSFLRDLLERRLANGLPVCKVTVHSDSVYAKSDCVLHNGLEEFGALRQWTNAFLARVREIADCLKSARSEIEGSESESSELEGYDGLELEDSESEDFKIE